MRMDPRSVIRRRYCWTIAFLTVTSLLFPLSYHSKHFRKPSQLVARARVTQSISIHCIRSDSVLRCILFSRHQALSKLRSPSGLRSTIMIYIMTIMTACWGSSSHAMGPAVSIVHSLCQSIDGNALQQQHQSFDGNSLQQHWSSTATISNSLAAVSFL
jgi:hypothetical protein